MRQLTEITELSDTELEAVSGGFSLNFGKITTQCNIGLNVAVGLDRLSNRSSVREALPNHAFHAHEWPRGSAFPWGPFYLVAR